MDREDYLEPIDVHDSISIDDLDKIEVVLHDMKKVQVNTSTKLKAFDDWTICLDTCAEESIFKNKRFFEELKELEPISIQGVSGSTDDGLYTATGGGTMFGKAYYNRQVITNVLSFGNVVDHLHSVAYDAERDFYTVQPYANGDKYLFKRIKAENNLYKCEIRKKGYVIKNSKVIVTTVKENEMKYAEREVLRAKIARRYIKNSGYMTPGTIAKLIHDDGIKDADINAQDIARCIDIYGKDLGNLKGKTTRTKAIKYEREFNILEKNWIKEKQILYIDVLYYNGNTYLYGVTSQPLHYRMVRKIASRSTQDLYEAIVKFLTNTKDVGIQLVVIRCDQEAGVVTDNLKIKLMQFDPTIDIDLSPSGEAVGVIERDIRVVKERLRAIENTIPFHLDELLEEWLIKYVVYYLNWEPNKQAVDKKSAYRRLKNRTIDAKVELICGFGDYYQLNDGSSNNTTDERVKGAMTLMPTGNVDGSWYMLSLTSWKTIIRRPIAGNLMPYNDVAINWIDQKAANSRRKRRIHGDNNVIGLWRSEIINIYNDDNVQQAADDADYVEYMPTYIDLSEQEISHMDGDGIVFDDNDNIPESLMYPPAENLDEVSADEVYEQQDSEPVHTVHDHGTHEPYEVDEITDNNEINNNIMNEPDNNIIINDNIPNGSSYNLRPTRAMPGRWRGIAVSLRNRTKAYKVIKYDQLRIKQQNHIARSYTFNMTINQGIKKLGFEAVRSVVAEIMQIHDKGTIEGKCIEHMNEDEIKRIINSKTFLKDKYTPEGIFDKLKARLVVGGQLQDREIYDNGQSTTNSSNIIIIFNSSDSS